MWNDEHDSGMRLIRMENRNGGRVESLGHGKISHRSVMIKV